MICESKINFCKKILKVCEKSDFYTFSVKIFDKNKLLYKLDSLLSEERNFIKKLRVKKILRFF